MKSAYKVFGWLDGRGYDYDAKPDAVIEVTAHDLSEAEDIADKKFKKSIGTCEVIVGEPL